MSSQFQNKVVIVTGANSGFGQAIALLFARRGAAVTLCGRDQERLKSVYEQAVEASGGHEERFTTVQGDLNEGTTRRNVVSTTVKKFGRVDILVANAGSSGENTNISDATEETYDYEMNSNLKSVFFLVQEALPELKKSKGNIVFVSSIVSTVPQRFRIIYPMAKAATDQLARCLAVELASEGIRVNTVNPSFFPTRVLRTLPMEAVQQFNDSEITRQPFENRLVTPDEVAETVAFLSSEAASFITGQNIIIDGGRQFLGYFGQF